ncbi:sulfotransferase [Aliiglaciecola litoralis]|uniref:Sulfotransferase family protein n=1 Tax=Aliiglaciecola litoralis TaxID=582857 RepID=A0ABP3WVC7_9ALTE
MMNKKALLICGQMRSGTTLLANFLNAQKSISVHRDRATVLFRTQDGIEHPLDFSLQIDQQQRESIQLSLDKNIRKIFEAKEKDNKRIEAGIEEQYMLKFDTKTCRNYRDIIHQCFEQMAAPQDSYVGTKVTLCEHNVPPFLQQFNGKAIGIVRNPLNVISSLISRQFFDGRKAPLASTYIRSWKRGTNRLLQCKDANLLLLKFEDFVGNKTETCEKLSAFLELDINPNIDQLFDYGLPWKGNSSFQQNLSVADESVITRKVTLPKHIEDEILSTCNDEMQKFGWI